MDELPDLGLDVGELEKDTAAGALAELPKGGLALLHIALERTADVRLALEEGRFVDAERHVAELGGKVSPLSSAQATLGTFAAATRIRRARDIGVGDHLYGIGVVEQRDERECAEQGSRESHLHVILHIEGRDKPYEVSEAQELAVMVADGDASG